MPRYLSLVRIDESSTPAEGPSEQLMQRMGELIEEVTKAGVMLDTAGLTPSAQGTRVRWEGGTLSVTDGPFTETKELIAGFGLIEVRSKEEAVEWAKRFVDVFTESGLDVEVDVRRVSEGPHEG